MKKDKDHNIISSLTKYYNSIDAGKFSWKKLFRLFYCIVRFFWITWVFICNVTVFIIITGIYFILGKTCRGCAYLRKDKGRETKWCEIYSIQLNRKCRDYKKER